MNNEPVALTQGDILGILQDANSVPLGQPIFNSSEEYNKLKAIIESAIRYTHPAKTLTDEEQTYKDLYIGAIKQLNKMLGIPDDGDIRFKWIAVELSERLDELAILRKAQENERTMP